MEPKGRIRKCLEDNAKESLKGFKEIIDVGQADSEEIDIGCWIKGHPIDVLVIHQNSHLLGTMWKIETYQ